MANQDPEGESREAPAIYTVGHSNHAFDAFLEILKRHVIQVVVDVRSSPYSRWVDHFNREVFGASLKYEGLRYMFLGDALGGAPDDDAFYDGEGHVLYGRIAETPQFEEAIRKVIDEATRSRLALVCGEEDPTDCHRFLLIGRVLGERGLRVLHIRGDGAVQTEEEIEKAGKPGAVQLLLFEDPEEKAWRSTQSVSRKKAPRSSSVP